MSTPLTIVSSNGRQTVLVSGAPRNLLRTNPDGLFVPKIDEASSSFAGLMSALDKRQAPSVHWLKEIRGSELRVPIEAAQSEVVVAFEDSMNPQGLLECISTGDARSISGVVTRLGEESFSLTSVPMVRYNKLERIQVAPLIRRTSSMMPGFTSIKCMTTDLKYMHIEVLIVGSACAVRVCQAFCEGV